MAQRCLEACVNADRQSYSEQLKKYNKNLAFLDPCHNYFTASDWLCSLNLNFTNSQSVMSLLAWSFPVFKKKSVSSYRSLNFIKRANRFLTSALTLNIILLSSQWLTQPQHFWFAFVQQSFFCRHYFFAVSLFERFSLFCCYVHSALSVRFEILVLAVRTVIVTWRLWQKLLDWSIFTDAHFCTDKADHVSAGLRIYYSSSIWSNDLANSKGHISNTFFFFLIFPLFQWIRRSRGKIRKATHGVFALCGDVMVRHTGCHGYFQ